MCNSRVNGRNRDSRRGTTVVETALVLPVFLLFVLALIEFGHAQMVNNLLRNACRSAARVGSTEGRSSAEVEARVRDMLAPAVDANNIHVFVKDANAFEGGGDVPASGEDLEAMPSLELTEAEARQLFMVRARIDYSDIAIVPHIPILCHFLDDVVLEGQAFMRHE